MSLKEMGEVAGMNYAAVSELVRRLFTLKKLWKQNNLKIETPFMNFEPTRNQEARIYE